MPYSHDFLLARLLYRDGLLLIIDKPAGLPVHAGPGGGPNLEQYLEPLRFGLPQPPALAHRLDRDASGCLVLGRHRKALETVLIDPTADVATVMQTAAQEAQAALDEKLK